MVGNNVRGKCDQCGQWWYTKEVGSNGRWIPEVNSDGSQVIDTWGKPRYRQHIHECRGASGAQKATTFEKQITTLADDVDVTRHTNMKNLFSFAADMAIVRSKTEVMEKDIEKIKMYLEAFMRTQSRQSFQQANELPKSEDNNNDSGDLADEIANTDDKTSLDSHSINFVDQTDLTDPPK